MPILKTDDRERFEKGEEWFRKQLIKKGFDLTKPIKIERHTIADISIYKQEQLHNSQRRSHCE